jgi:hypothetical protein
MDVGIVYETDTSKVQAQIVVLYRPLMNAGTPCTLSELQGQL